MKVLSIGNSFSQDAHKWLHTLAEQNGHKIETTNLYIGGCNLERHWNNYINDNKDYDLEINGGKGIAKVSINEMLKKEKWDVITLQQASKYSGIYETYLPYVMNLSDIIKVMQPQAKLYFHQTWAYEIDSEHEGFANYENDQNKMYRSILKASQSVADDIEAQIIPVGKAIQKLRQAIKDFDYKNGGLSLCRDGFHLSYDYGRYAAAATWLRTLGQKNVTALPFEDFDINLLQKIVRVTNSVK